MGPKNVRDREKRSRTEGEREKVKAPPGGLRGPITSAGPLSSGAHTVLIVHLPPYQASQSIQRYITASVVFSAVSSPRRTEKRSQNSLSSLRFAKNTVMDVIL